MLWDQWTGHLKELITVDGLFSHHRRIQKIHLYAAQLWRPKIDLVDADFSNVLNTICVATEDARLVV